MANVTIGLGAILVLLGIGSYLGTGTSSITALIPAFLGVILVVCGVLAQKENLKKHAMHFAVLIGLVGAVGSGMRGFKNLPDLIAGTAKLPIATTMQVTTAVLCIIYVGLCVNSFIQARRNRNAAA